jgi:hypothetical protein
MARTEQFAPRPVNKTERAAEEIRKLEDLAAAYGARLPAALIASFDFAPFDFVRAAHTAPRASGN